MREREREREREGGGKGEGGRERVCVWIQVVKPCSDLKVHSVKT